MVKNILFCRVLQTFLGTWIVCMDLYIKQAHPLEIAFRDLFQTVIPTLVFQIPSS